LQHVHQLHRRKLIAGRHVNPRVGVFDVHLLQRDRL
jgi:hypothetical protein